MHNFHPPLYILIPILAGGQKWSLFWSVRDTGLLWCVLDLHPLICFVYSSPKKLHLTCSSGLWISLCNFKSFYLSFWLTWDTSNIAYSNTISAIAWNFKFICHSNHFCSLTLKQNLFWWLTYLFLKVWNLLYSIPFHL